MLENDLFVCLFVWIGTLFVCVIYSLILLTTRNECVVRFTAIMLRNYFLTKKKAVVKDVVRKIFS